MPALLLMLIGGLAEAAASFAGRALIGLGVQVVAYKGLDILLENVLQYSMNNLTGVPATIVGIIGLFRVDECLSILSGAVAASLTISGLRNGVLTKWVK